MAEDWQEIDGNTPRDGTLLRLWCPGVGPNPKPFECDGRYIGGGWVGVDGGRVTGLIDPRRWKPLFFVTRRDSGVSVVFTPTDSHYDFRFLADPEDIAEFGLLSGDVMVRHGKTGDTGKYIESELLSEARRLAEKVARGDPSK
jgi:hypothetical protein